MTNELVQRETLTALVGTYQQAETEIRQAYDLLETASNRLKSAFVAGTGYHFDVNNSSRPGVGAEASDKCMLKLKQDAWRCIVNRLDLRKILSIKRREELDRQLYDESGRDKSVPPLPEITVENIFAMYQDSMAKSVDYAREAVYEVFDWLRPRSGHTAALKTNEKWRIGKKVIIGYACESNWGNGYHVKYHHQKELTALDNIFHMLDGLGPLKTPYGPLIDAITASPDGIGETSFFRFRCHKNNNIHIEFKRVDLVVKINKMAGGNRLGMGDK